MSTAETLPAEVGSALNITNTLSTSWHWFVIAGTLISLVLIMWLLYANRKTSPNETTGHVWDGIEELDTPLPMWWIGMFVLSVVFTVGYLIVYPGLGNFEGAIGWSSTKEHDRQAAQHQQRYAPLYAELAALPTEELQNNRMAMQVGRRLFINNCSTCHGVSAAGTFGYPNLTDKQWLWGADFNAIKTSIASGRIGVMPGWGAALGEDGTANVVQYVLQLAAQPHDSARAALGAPQYQAICASCHGAAGEGIAALGAPDLRNNIWQYGGSEAQLYFTISNGRTGNMPAHGELLGADKVHIVAAYVDSLSK